MIQKKVNIDLFDNSLKKLELWINKENYKGYDPYDFLTSRYINHKNKKFNFYFQQIGKFFPINLRPYIGIKKRYDPKSLSLISYAYLILDKVDKGRNLLDILIKLRWKQSKYYAWGLSFPWQSREFYLDAYEPNIVATSIAGLTFLSYYGKLQDKIYLDIGISTANYILSEINRFENDKMLCFNYTKYDHSKVTDANLFAGALFSQLYKYTSDELYLTYIEKILNYTKTVMNEDGSITYGYTSNGEIINQLDYHQGFNISLMLLISHNTGINLNREIKLAANYYMERMFNQKGVSKYRNNVKWPIDIHNQAQGIITFSQLSAFKEEKYLQFSEKIALWTILHMQDPSGYFYYQKWPFFINKIPYMRWGQAWMMLALAMVLKRRRDL